MVAALACALTYGLVQKFIFSPPGYDKQLMYAASELNKSCPFMVDESTRLDNAVAMPGKVFQYNYTLLQVSKEELDIDTLKKYLEPDVINSVRTSPDLKPFRDNEVTMSYSYKDKAGVFVYKFSVTPDMYKDTQ